MTLISKEAERIIIDDFAAAINEKKIKSKPPSQDVIDFRNEIKDGKPRNIYLVPIELLRYRKENGRISSDVLDYEKSHGVLDEKSKESQIKIRQFLESKDKPKTEELTQLIIHDGQLKPAIITCDGFLINGNRRKMVMEKLKEKFKGDRFNYMKVVILPGKGEEGGPPTLIEIEEIENRYQLQSEGKADYTAIDRALSIRRKRSDGMSLEEQLKDDAQYSELTGRKFKDVVKKYEKDYLEPLECIDRYLKYLRRSGLYSTVSLGYGDPEGRWQAFYDYYHSIREKLEDPKKRLKLEIDENEIGKIEEICFKIIRKREFKDLPKVHTIIRDVPKWLSSKSSKKELLRILEIETDLPKTEKLDVNGKEYSERDIDKLWGQKHNATLLGAVKNAKNYYEQKKDEETPLDILDAVLKKLNHGDLDPNNLKFSDLNVAMKKTQMIQKKASELEREFYKTLKLHKSIK